ncbi:MAG: dUTP diphosphatase [Candidatus Thorarchaeota archaeon]
MKPDEPVTVRVRLLSPYARTPTMAREGDAAFDLYAAEDYDLRPGEFHAVATGIALEIPEGYEGEVRPRSGLAANHGVTVLNSPGTIDSGYRGEVKSILVNLGPDVFQIRRGMRISQLAIRPIPRVKMMNVETLSDSERGSSGFGSTGL